MNHLSRRDFAVLAGGAMLTAPAWARAAADTSVITRAIPSTGERLPVVGLGTASVFNDNDAPARAAATNVIRALINAGGKLIDTSSVYGDAEAVLGDVLKANGWHTETFVATKLEEPNQDELQRSLQRLKTSKIDLLQLHNVRDQDQSLKRFKEWKAQGICRYIGITSTYHGDFDAVETVLARETPDFVQIDYSIDDRTAERRILPLAAEVKAGVLTALPFGRARLFRAVRGKPVPDWAHGFAQSWAQFFLKFLIADPRITAVIPGTNDPVHMKDNLGAMRGPLPDPEQRRRMIQFVEGL
jgi:aryl-alcohol dehydrogenase-like predicted oxidoreductase